MNKQKHLPLMLIAVGGFAGTGKTTLSRRLSVEFSIPRLGSDTLGRTIKTAISGQKTDIDAYWLAYEVLFRLSEEFIQSGVSVILDLTLGWEFQWQRMDHIVQQYPQTLFLPIILQCSHEQCIERTRQRYEEKPDYYDPPERYMTDPRILKIWAFLADLRRPDIHYADANKPQHEVYADVRKYISLKLNAGFEPSPMNPSN